jgi:hypothetical protein
MKDRRQPDEAKGAMKPEQQTGEEFGSIKKGQLDDRTMPEKDLARGSEPDTAGASHNRR